MPRSESPKQYAWESDRSRSRSRERNSGRRRNSSSPSGGRYSPPSRRARSDSRRNRRRGRSRSRRRSRSRSRGKNAGKKPGKQPEGRPCFAFVAKMCKLGDRCTWWHPDEEARKRFANVLRSQPCKLGASCNRPGCLYGHPDDDRRRDADRRNRGRSSSSSRSSSEPRIPMMKAIGLKSYGDMSVLEDLQLPKPVLDSKGKELLVRLRGSSMNTLDIKMREGEIDKKLSPDGYRIMGYSSAGVIEEMGREAMASGKFRTGDEVWFANSWKPTAGSNQQYCLIDYRVASLKPRSLESFADAAAIPLVALTVWGAMIEHMNMDLQLCGSVIKPPRFTPDNKGVFLALPGGGAEGSFALQLAARYLNKNKNLIVIAAAAKPEAVEWCKKMGAEHVINHNSFDFKDELDKLGIKGLDYVFYGTPPAQHDARLYAAMNPLGQIASYHEANFEKMDSFFPKRLSLHREYPGARAMLDYFPEVDGEVLATVAQLFDDQSVRLETVVTQKFPALTAETVRQAHAQQFLKSIDGDATGTAAFEIK